jgi:activator of HSP90 ATPase
MMNEIRKLKTASCFPTRRQMIARATLTLSGLAVGLNRASASTGDEISRSEESIHQENSFKASRHRVYEALTNARQFNEVTKISAASDPGIPLDKSPTVIGLEAGSAFTLFGGIILGRQIELVPDTRIVQAWRVMNWKPGVYSLAKFELVEEGAGTRIVFDHTGFPKGDAEHLAAGWKAHYWDSLAKFLA